MIYVIGEAPSGVVKIGYSDKPNQRVGHMQTGNAVPLRLLAVFEGGPDDEKSLHNHFTNRRTRGEWFDFTDSDAVEAVDFALARGPLAVDMRNAGRRRLLGLKPEVPTDRPYSMMLNATLAEIACDRDMPRAELAMVLFLTACADDNGVTVTTLEQVADATGYTLPVILGANKGLVKRGYVVKLRRGMYRVAPKVAVPYSRDARADTWQLQRSALAPARLDPTARGIPKAR